MNILYFVIPTINGEIFGNAIIYYDYEKMLKEIKFECIIYKIDLVNQLVFELAI